MGNKDVFEMIPIYIMGKKYEIPMGLTIMKALEYSGYHLTRGCGCRGGVCGACVTIYRKKNEYKWQIGLACQTVAEKDTFLVQLPYVPAHKAPYDLRSLEPTEESVIGLYPELLRCMGCNTCTRSCPMELEVMNYVSAALQGDWETVTKLSMDCIMCGMCAARCPGELAPFNIAMLVRRMVGKAAHQTPPSVAKRLEEIKSGKFKDEIQKLKGLTKDELLPYYQEFQSTKGEAV
ncbi:4Fe-4S dicluster domain-containing protein [Desulfocicer niacini]